MGEERRKKQEQFAAERGKGGFAKGIIAMVVIVAAGLVGYLLLGQSAKSGYQQVQSVSGDVRIDLAGVDDGQAHFYRYATDRGEVSFFVVKSVDGVMRAAFDACDVCYKEKKGYYQEGNMMVCRNCGQKFRTDLVNEVKGGCNPAPLARRIDAGQLVINDRDILKGAWYFGG